MKILFRIWISIMLFLIIHGNLYSLNYEIGFRVTNNSDAALSREIIVYKMINKNLVAIDSGWTITNFNTWSQLYIYEVNGACDIIYTNPNQTTDTNNPTIQPLLVSRDNGAIYYIRIGNKYIELMCDPFEAQLGDLVILYNESTEYLDIVYNDTE